MLQKSITWGSVLIALVSLSLWVNDKYGIPAHGSAHVRHEIREGLATTPTEGGQSAFAALIELVAMLERDSDTDWRQVNIDQLRLHLRDMNSFMLDTEAGTTVIRDRQIRFVIEGSHSSTTAIHRMVPAHASYIRQSRGWTIDTELTDTGASVTIHTDDTATLEKLNALGIYGFMSLDSHHQAHHFQMATGMAH